MPHTLRSGRGKPSALEDLPPPVQTQLRLENIPGSSNDREVVSALNGVLRRRNERPVEYTFGSIQARGNTNRQRKGHPREKQGQILFRKESEAHEAIKRLQDRKVVVQGIAITFSVGNGDIWRGLVLKGRDHTRPTVPRDLLLQKMATLEKLDKRIRVTAVQFGVLGRNKTDMSVEWEGDYDPDRPMNPIKRSMREHKATAWLKFNDRREDENPRSIQIEIYGASQDEAQRVTIPMGEINTMEYNEDCGQPFVILSLFNPPSFETKSHYAASSWGSEIRDKKNSWLRIQALDDAHKRVVPYTSRTIRVVLSRDQGCIDEFKLLSSFTALPRMILSTRTNILESIHLFSQDQLAKVSKMLEPLPWKLAFQCKALLQNCLLDTTELLQLRRQVQRLVSIGVEYAEDVLALYALILASKIDHENPLKCLERAEREHQQRGYDDRLTSIHHTVFQSRHVTVTPTSYIFQGPYVEQTNRVIRNFGPKFEEYFLRVTFSDEGGALYRRDYEVDNEAFVRERVGHILKNGITIAGRHFVLLGCSSSGLRRHSMWFVAPFIHPRFGRMDAEGIRNSLGDFTNVINFPARYCSRIGQAFTATYPTIVLQPHEILQIDDLSTRSFVTSKTHDGIEGRTYCFTDGAGTISPDLADEMWDMLKQQKAEAKIVKSAVPRAYQIRIGGCKGVVSADYRLKGQRVLCLRPSMIKFYAPNWTTVEICQEFNKPLPLHLNRPLIMLLETLGIQQSVFLRLQDDAMEFTKRALDDAESTSKLLERFDIGSAFSLPTFIRKLHSFGLDHIVQQSAFIRRLLNAALYHAHRDLKYYARIPVPNSWTLVGIADEHGMLEEGEVYACIDRPGEERRWIEGPVLVCRSPTVHLGDVQKARAVGKPSPGSPFDVGVMSNCLVFPTRGRRDLPSCLGGGDLDGDLYSIITAPELIPLRCEEPADYPPSRLFDLNRPSTIRDVSDFLLDYINCDALGVIGSNQLRLADEKLLSMRDKDCVKLADHYSIAVDYPKTGVATKVSGLPQPWGKPDWYCSETLDPMNGDFYPSKRALGALFRNVRLPSTGLDDPSSGGLENLFASVSNKTREGPETSDHHVIDKVPFLQLFHKYSWELTSLCANHHLSQSPNQCISEEEVILGTILCKTAQLYEARKRSTLIERLRERSEIMGKEQVDPKGWLRRAEAALEVAQHDVAGKFGSNSFALIAMQLAMDALNAVDATT